VVTEAEQLLDEADTIVLVDWPTVEVPDTLARSGYAVIVKGGPEPDNFSARELRDGEVTVRRVSQPPERADLVYSHRPIEELGGIVGLAKQLGAKAVWCQSGLASCGVNDPRGCWVPDDKSEEARRLVESAGLAYFDDRYIVDVVRGLTPSRRRNST
jgi:predicted CoA-binding protein